MERINGMEEIENAQTELCRLLIDMMPVRWSRICFYGEYANKQLSFWFAPEEKLTGEIVTIAGFWKRYDSYPITRKVAENDLVYWTYALYKAYLKRFGSDKTWSEYYLTINEDYSFHADLGYEAPISDEKEKNSFLIQKFFS